MRKEAILFLTVWACLPLCAQKVHKRESRTPEETRTASDARSFMELFTKLENGVTLAVQEKNASELDRVLAPEFVVRSGANPENPILRVDWIRQVKSWSLRSYDLHTFAIRAFATEAIVSYVQSQRALFDGQDRSGEYFIVDLWVVNHGDWQLAARYISPIGMRSKAN
ncbi:MAG TPA: nuclear transport factor 2 family protein [Candidatus Sulfotelmatobacter sp.]|nr:nuclear transport factor 2 family protein [Candidatus Sulfotelmatobacter sp.]